MMEFIPVEKALPPEDKPVLGLRQSGYVHCKYEVITCRYMPTYRPLSPWRDLSNDSVNDSGGPIIAWAYADNLLEPRN